jgi:peptidoglycan hydrolase-like protein with peptidoglycan-binding domain
MTDPYAYGARSDQIRALQQALAARGLYADAVDGIFGPHTRHAIDKARARLGLPAGGVDDALLLDLGLMPSPPLPMSVRLALALLLPQLKGLFAMTFLSGYRTYIIAGLMLITGVAGVLGVDIPNLTGQTPGDLVMQALAFFFLRQGLKVATTNVN